MHLNANGKVRCSTVLSTGRIDPPWVPAEGWQAFIGQNNFIEFGKTPYVPGRKRRHSWPRRLRIDPAIR